MELELVVNILMSFIPIIIALASLSYAIKQRGVIKKELSRKQLLESARLNLNAVIDSLKKAQDFNLDKDSDDYAQAEFMVWEILQASFELKKKKIQLELSYQIRVWDESSKNYAEMKVKTIRNLSQYDSKWFFDLMAKRLVRFFFLETDTKIVGFERVTGNEFELNQFVFALENLFAARNSFYIFADVYETISPGSLGEVNNLVEELTELGFEIISNPKKIEVDFAKYSTADEISEYLFEQATGYPLIQDKLSNLPGLISKLYNVRKELFLKIP